MYLRSGWNCAYHYEKWYVYFSNTGWLVDKIRGNRYNIKMSVAIKYGITHHTRRILNKKVGFTEFRTFYSK